MKYLDSYVDIYIPHFSIFIESGKEVTEGDENYILLMTISYLLLCIVVSSKTSYFIFDKLFVNAGNNV